MKGLKNRDSNWLFFNERVLQEAEDASVPLIERLKFLAIFSSNLDEFFKVRVSQMRQLKSVDKELRKKLSLKGSKQLQKILSLVGLQQERFGQAIDVVLAGLGAKGIHIRKPEELNEEQKEFLQDYFNTHLREHLHLSSIDGHLLDDGELYLLIRRSNNDLCFLNIPSKSLGRFVILPAVDHEVMYLEDVIRFNLSLVFQGEETSNAYAIKLSRDAELYLEDDYTDQALVEKIYRSLDKRASGQPTRLLYDKKIPEDMLLELQNVMGLGEADLVPGGHYHNISDFFGFPHPDNSKDLVYEELSPLPHPTLRPDQDLFKAIKAKDRLVHFPYQRFELVEAFIQQAAEDPQVSSIKITLYRIAKSSALSDALLKAIEAGKEVVIFVEAQARFDEENNIKWGRIFKEAGAEVIFSVPQIKVHSKIALVSREQDGEIHRFGYIGTGNFNAKTARLYCDHGLLTAHKGITTDLEQVFLLLQKKLLFPKLKHLLVSPFSTRNAFLDLIRFEVEQARMGKASGITLKMNSLEDTQMITALQNAAEEGVPVRLLIRGFCCLKQKKMEELKPKEKPIYITSIIDRFLEHGRIYHFEHGGNPKMFTGSADWMTRNLDRRVEVLCPVLDQDVFEELWDLFQIQLRDNVKARIIDREDSNNYVRTQDQEAVRSQYALYEFLSKKADITS